MLKIEYKDYKWEYFPNGEIKFPDPGLRSSDVYDHVKIDWIFESNEEFFVLQMLVKYLRDCSFSSQRMCRIGLRMPFCPYGQQDRPIEGQIFSFKYFAQMLNDLKFIYVVFYDPHSRVMEAAVNNSRAAYLPLSKEVLDNLCYDMVFYPDNGSAKKYTEIYPGLPYRFGNKRRNLDTGEILEYEVIADRKDINGKSILIVDDLCMGGRTFKEAAKTLVEMGASKIGLQITHFMPQSLDFLKTFKQFGINQVITYSEGISSLTISKLTEEERQGIILSRD